MTTNTETKPKPKYDNETNPDELMKRDINDVQFHFANTEDAFRGCASLKQLHDNCFSEWYKDHFVAKTGVGLEYCDRQSALYNKCLKAKLDALKLSGIEKRTTSIPTNIGSPPPPSTTTTTTTTTSTTTTSAPSSSTNVEASSKPKK